jgi:hypothetical protein
MAKQWKNFGKKLDDAAKDALYESGIDFRGLGSDDERIDSALSVLSRNPDLWNKERYDELRVMKARRDRSTKDGDKFGIENAARIIDTWSPRKEGKKSISIGDQFFDAYWKADKKTRSFWKTAIEDSLGEGAWDEVKLRLNNRLKDEAAAQADRDRRAIVEGNAEGQGVSDWLASAVGGMLMPRTKQKALEGKEIKGKDIALDAAESVAMALPFGAATWAGKAATAAAIPFASEVLDDIAYDTENPNDIADRANFNPVDAAVGTLVNFVAPEAMNRALKKAGSKFFRGGEGAATDVIDVVKDLKENGKWNLPKDWKAEANELRRIEADKIESDVLSDLKKEAGFLANDAEEREAVDKLASTFDLVEYAEDTQNKKLLDDMLEHLDKNLGNDPELRKSFDAAVDYYNMSKGLGEKPDFRTVLESEMSDYYGRTNNIVRDAAEDMGQLTIDQRKKLLKADELRNLYEATEVVANKKTKDVNKGGNVTRVRKYPDNFTQAEKIAAGMEDNMDNILTVRNSGADFGDYMSLAHPKLTETMTYAKDVLNTLAANKAGNQSNVEKAAAPIEAFLGTPGAISKPVRKLQTEQRENAKKAQAKAVLNVMAEKAKTEEDRKWLGVIARNPSVVRGEGAEALNPEFRKWMLVRGSDILRGTDLYRPTFDVE